MKTVKYLFSLYFEICKKNFQNNMVYRSNTFMGILNTFIVVVVNISVWKALYGNSQTVNGVNFMATVTNLILGIGISSAFFIDEFFVANKIRTGDISSDLLKPINFKFYILSVNLGNISYRLLIQFLPTLILSALIFGLLPPSSFLNLIFFIVSLVMGFLVLYYLSFCLSLISFWYFNIWSFVTFKNALITVFSGVYLPYWFMPKWVNNIVDFTPFKTIYATPINVYLGNVSLSQIPYYFGQQIIWIIVLWAISRLLWKIGNKRLTIQGG